MERRQARASLSTRQVENFRICLECANAQPTTISIVNATLSANATCTACLGSCSRHSRWRSFRMAITF